MQQDTEQPDQDLPEEHQGSRITGLGQKILGEIEELAGVINADPLAQAEGEFNVEVGTVREELEEGYSSGGRRTSIQRGRNMDYDRGNHSDYRITARN